MPTPEIQIVSKLPGIPLPARFRRWLSYALPADATVTLRVVNAVEARRLNHEFRNRDYAPNVLTFAYGGMPPTADIVLCAQVVAREAREQGKSLAAHYAHLAVHGALHGLGFDHVKRGEAKVMETREVEILDTLGFDNPYVDAVTGTSRKAVTRQAA